MKNSFRVAQVAKQPKNQTRHPKIQIWTPSRQQSRLDESCCTKAYMKQQAKNQ